MSVTGSQYRNWGSNDGQIKFTSGSIALYQFDLSSLSSAEGTLKSATLKVEQTSTDNCYNIYLLGYNGGWDAFSNSTGTIKGTVDDTGSFQPLGDKYSGISNGSAAGTLSVDAKTYLQSAITAGKTNVSFAVAMNLTRTLHCTTSATLEVVYTTAVSHSYTVNAVFGETVLKQLASGETQEGLEYSVSGVPEYLSQTVDGTTTYYQLSDENVTNRQETFTMGMADEVKTINYVAASDITFFTEVEDAFTSSSTNYKTVEGSSYSGGKGRTGNRTGSQLTVKFDVPTTGNYEIAIYHADNGDRVNNYYLDNLTNVLESAKGSADADGAHIISTPLAAGSHTVAFAANYNLTAVFDYVTVKRTGDAAAPTVTIDETSNLASYSSTQSVQVPEDVVIYIASEPTDNVVTLTKVDTQIVPANTGVILYSATTGERTLEYVNSTDVSAFADNKLKSTAAEAYTVPATTTTNTKNNTTTTTDVYALVLGRQVLAKVQDGVDVPQGKAYLYMSSTSTTTTSTAKSLGVVFDGLVTSIDSVNGEKENAGVDVPAYNLAGQRVGKAYKGVVVKNGKKYIVK